MRFEHIFNWFLVFTLAVNVVLQGCPFWTESLVLQAELPLKGKQPLWFTVYYSYFIFHSYCVCARKKKNLQLLSMATLLRKAKAKKVTVRSDVEDKNIPAWPKNISVFVKFWPVTICTVRYKSVMRTQPEDKNVQLLKTCVLRHPILLYCA